MEYEQGSRTYFCSPGSRAEQKDDDRMIPFGHLLPIIFVEFSAQLRVCSSQKSTRRNMGRSNVGLIKEGYGKAESSQDVVYCIQ